PIATRLPASTAVAASDAPTAAAAGPPARRGDATTTLVVAWDQVPDNLDPQTARGNRNWWVLAEIYGTLTWLPGGSLDAAPLLAESWEVSDGGRVYTFRLRPGVRFSTGQELSADAVKFSIDRLHEIKLGPLYMTDAYDRTDVVDSLT